jgi:hypothetical protein
METRQGKIEKKSMAFAKNKAPYATFTIDGRNYNSFDPDIVDNFNPDDFVEFTGEQGDRFWTLKTMKKIEEGEMAFNEKREYLEKQNTVKEYHLSPEEVKCRALECAITHWRTMGNDYSTDDVLDIADKFVEWIRNGN